MSKVLSFKKYSQVVDEFRHPKEFKKGVKRLVTWAAQVERDHIDHVHNKWGPIAVIGDWLLLKEEGKPIVMSNEKFKRRFPNPQIIG